MKCMACDNDLTDREAGLKDETGEHYDLCGECLPVAREALQDASESTDWQDEGIEVEEDTRSDLDYWTDFLALHWANLTASWSDGLGLMDPMDRVWHLRERAYMGYVYELATGTPRPLAAERGIQAPWVDRVG